MPEAIAVIISSYTSRPELCRLAVDMSIACSSSATFSRRNLHQLLILPVQLRTFTTSHAHHQERSKIAEAVQNENVRNEEQVKTYDKMDYTAKKEKKPVAVPRPSASVLLISPQNQILLLQRVKQSSSFPSAHVFPGGNVSEFHDGRAPEPDHPDRHVDGDAYRMAAIRETFEESGLLLARNNGFGRLIEVPQTEREAGRVAVHSSEVSFPKWLAQKGGRADVQGLTPFTRWVTPPNVPKRFTTQMYLYFLPTLASSPLKEGSGEPDDSEAEVDIPSPTTDGGKEHTTARFLPASVWCRLAQEGRIILFPPQFFLLHQIAQHFDDLKSPTDYASISRAPLPREELEARRRRLMDFVKTGSPPWTDMCISPIARPSRDGKLKGEDGRQVLSLHHPGVEVEKQGLGRAGVKDQVVLVDFQKEGPRRLNVISREDALKRVGKL